jgi:hypothetical protein
MSDYEIGMWGAVPLSKSVSKSNSASKKNKSVSKKNKSVSKKNKSVSKKSKSASKKSKSVSKKSKSASKKSKSASKKSKSASNEWNEDWDADDGWGDSNGWGDSENMEGWKSSTSESSKSMSISGKDLTEVRKSLFPPSVAMVQTDNEVTFEIDFDTHFDLKRKRIVKKNKYFVATFTFIGEKWNVVIKDKSMELVPQLKSLSNTSVKGTTVTIVNAFIETVLVILNNCKYLRKRGWEINLRNNKLTIDRAKLKPENIALFDLYSVFDIDVHEGKFRLRRIKGAKKNKFSYKKDDFPEEFHHKTLKNTYLAYLTRYANEYIKSHIDADADAKQMMLDLCKDELDPYTLEGYTDYNDIMYFIIDDGKKEKFECGSISAFNASKQGEKFVEWVKNPDAKENNEEGYGYHPKIRSQKYFKFGIKFVSTITIRTRLKFPPVVKLTSIGRKRIGNTRGIFGVGSLHGQAPGEQLYKATLVSINDLKERDRKNAVGGQIYLLWESFNRHIMSIAGTLKNL